MNFIRKYLENRNVTFYVCLVVCLLAIITSVFALISFIGLGEKYFNPLVSVLLIIGPAIFIGSSFTPYSKIGCGLMALCYFASFVLFACFIYQWPADQIMTKQITEVEKFPEIIICAVLLIIISVTANVCAWKNHTKEDKKEAK